MVLVHKKSNALKKEKIHDCSLLAMSAHPEKDSTKKRNVQFWC